MLSEQMTSICPRALSCANNSRIPSTGRINASVRAMRSSIVKSILKRSRNNAQYSRSYASRSALLCAGRHSNLNHNSRANLKTTSRSIIFRRDPALFVEQQILPHIVGENAADVEDNRFDHGFGFSLTYFVLRIPFILVSSATFIIHENVLRSAYSVVISDTQTKYALSISTLISMYLTLNSASLYFETFGDDHPDRVPIILIHGSTVRSRRLESHRAATRLKVFASSSPIVADTANSNPNLSYSFKEMADDVARAYSRHSGYQRAHVIGHSNGGNVALVTLVEHPDVVQTCVVQAANAFVVKTSKRKNRSTSIRSRRARTTRLDEAHDRTSRRGTRRKLLARSSQDHLRRNDHSSQLHRIVCKSFAPDARRARRKKISPTLIRIMASSSPKHPARRVLVAQNRASRSSRNYLEWLSKILDFLHRRSDDRNDALYPLKQDKI